VPLVRQIPSDATVNPAELPIDDRKHPTTTKLQRGDMLLLQVVGSSAAHHHLMQSAPVLGVKSSANSLAGQSTAKPKALPRTDRIQSTAWRKRYGGFGRIHPLWPQERGCVHRQTPHHHRHHRLDQARCAKVNNLRRAHDTEGRLNTARTPDGVQRYLTQEFDQLVPFPTSKFPIRDSCFPSRFMPFFLLDCVNARRYTSY